MQLESHIQKLVDEFVSGRIDHEQFQKEFASVWSAVSESSDGQGKYLACKVQSCLADFVEGLVSAQKLIGKLASIALPTQQFHIAMQIQEISHEEERIAPWADQGSSNIFEEALEVLSTSNENMIHNTA